MSQSGLVKSSAPATATTFIITSLLFFVMMITALMIFYIFIYGGYKTAQDGELFGKDWNSFWVPARSIGSAAMIIPIDAVSGMSGAQVLVVMVILGGSAFASTLGYYSFQYLMSMPVVEPSIVSNDEFVSSVAKARACIRINQELNNEIQAKPSQAYFDSSGLVKPGSLPVNTAPKSTVDRILGFFSFGGSGLSDPLYPAGSGDSKIRNRYIANTYKETGYNPLVFGITRFRYGQHGECGTLYIPTLPNQTVDYTIDPDISRRIYGTTRSRGRVKNPGTKRSDNNESEGLSTILESAGADGNDFYPKFDIAASNAQVWLASMRAARFSTVVSAYSELDSNVKLAMV